MTGFRASPAQIGQAGQQFAAGQRQLQGIWSTLTSQLQANAGMAGDDRYAQQFFLQYQKGGNAAWAGLGTAVDTLGGIAQGLTQAANNHLAADHASTVGASGGPQALPAPSTSTEVCILAIDDALGAGGGGLPGPLSGLWPDADTGKLRAAASSWQTTGTAIEQLAGNLNGVITSIIDTNFGADVDAMEGFWAKVYRIGDPHTILAGLPQMCQALGSACDRYADAVDSARGRMKIALAAAGIAVGLTTLAGIALTIFTFGGSDAAAAGADEAEVAAILAPEAAEAEATVSAETSAAVGEDLVSAVEDATAQTPEVQPVEAEATQVEQSADQELAQQPGDGTEGSPTLSEAQKVQDILSPGGSPIGEPGSPGVRVVDNEQDLQQVWDEIKTELGRPPDTVINTPKGPIDQYDLGDGDTVQYRPFSKSGGDTIDIQVKDEPIEKIHIK